MCQLRQCCCCISLKTGTVIIGVLELIASLIVVGTIVTTWSLSEYEETPEKSEEPAASDDMLGTASKVYYVYVLAVLSLHIIFDILLIVGAKQMKYAFVAPWLVLNAAVIVLDIVRAISHIIYFFSTTSDTNQATSTYNLSSLVTFLLSLALASYMLVVVYSFYNSIKNLRVVPTSDNGMITIRSTY